MVYCKGSRNLLKVKIASQPNLPSTHNKLSLPFSLGLVTSPNQASSLGVNSALFLNT